MPRLSSDIFRVLFTCCCCCLILGACSSANSVDGDGSAPSSAQSAGGSGGGGASAASSGGAGTPAGSGGQAAATGGSSSGGAGGAVGGGGAGGEDSTLVPLDELVGWASVDALGQNGTVGGGEQTPFEVSTFAQFESLAGGSEARILRVNGEIQGTIEIGSNKTIIGAPGSRFTGRLRVDGASNVILYNLTIVGYNCSDGSQCSAGADAVTISGASHHVWVHHCDISDGSDGNLDVVEGSDYVTISWTKFWYSDSGRDHRFSNLIGSDDDVPEDEGHLKVTLHHNWWADRVQQRMPRARYGQVHVFNNLYTSSDADYCIGLGVYANILSENNAFLGVSDPLNVDDFSNADSVLVSQGDLFDASDGEQSSRGTDVFDPPYEYTPDPAEGVEAAVESGAGVR